MLQVHKHIRATSAALHGVEEERPPGFESDDSDGPPPPPPPPIAPPMPLCIAGHATTTELSAPRHRQISLPITAHLDSRQSPVSTNVASTLPRCHLAVARNDVSKSKFCRVARYIWLHIE
jgi:hypothetical protein